MMRNISDSWFMRRSVKILDLCIYDKIKKRDLC